MLVTVYITNYNYGDYIEVAIQSVLNQTLQDFELIIIDDGSTDNSKEIIEQYKDHAQVKIVYQKNKGLNVTNNIALRASSGKYIVRLDADDFLKEDALEKLSSKLEADDELGLVFPNYYMVDADGKVISEEVRHDFDKEVQLFDQAAHGACTMIRSDFLRAVGGYNESYNCQDGYELWIKFTSHYKVSNVNEPLFYYRQHGANLTSNENKILDTRAKMNANFVKEKEEDASAIIIIPVRGGTNDLAFNELAADNFVNIKLKQALQTENAQKIVVSSPDLNVKETIAPIMSQNDEVIFHHRSAEQARFNVDLNSTVKAITELPEIKDLSYRAICVLTIEYPFLKPHKIDDAIHTMIVFGSDSLMSVRSDNSIYYVHRGDGLHPIMQRDEFTRLEREALFKQVGGIMVSNKEAFLKSNKLINGMVGHMVLDQESAFGVFSKYDLELARRIEEVSADGAILKK